MKFQWKFNSILSMSSSTTGNRTGSWEPATSSVKFMSVDWWSMSVCQWHSVFFLEINIFNFLLRFNPQVINLGVSNVCCKKGQLSSSVMFLRVVLTGLYWPTKARCVGLSALTKLINYQRKLCTAAALVSSGGRFISFNLYFITQTRSATPAQPRRGKIFTAMWGKYFTNLQSINKLFVKEHCLIQKTAYLER